MPAFFFVLSALCHLSLSGRARHVMLQMQTALKEDPMSLQGKTAVITGSNSGIGLGVAHELPRVAAPRPAEEVHVDS